VYSDHPGIILTLNHVLETCICVGGDKTLYTPHTFHTQYTQPFTHIPHTYIPYIPYIHTTHTHPIHPYHIRLTSFPNMPKTPRNFNKTRHGNSSPKIARSATDLKQNSHRNSLQSIANLFDSIVHDLASFEGAPMSVVEKISRDACVPESVVRNVIKNAGNIRATTHIPQTDTTLDNNNDNIIKKACTEIREKVSHMVQTLSVWNSKVCRGLKSGTHEKNMMPSEKLGVRTVLMIHMLKTWTNMSRRSAKACLEVFDWYGAKFGRLQKRYRSSMTCTNAAHTTSPVALKCVRPPVCRGPTSLSDRTSLPTMKHD
jgi:hypothetical protein